MSQRFDATMKQLLDDFAIDWMSWLAPRCNLPETIEVEPFPTDFASIQTTADKVFRLKEPLEGFLHIEPQSSWDGEFVNRMLAYCALIRWKYGTPVYSIALLLRPDANSPTITGILDDRHDDGSNYLLFRYVPIRVWELPAETLIDGPLGCAPLALLTNDAAGKLSEYIKRLDERMETEQIPESDRQVIHTATFILLGLRYDPAVVSQAFMGVNTMRESTTYQSILQEGRVEGRVEGRQEAVIELLEDRFGVLPVPIIAEIRSVSDIAQLKSLLHQAAHIASLDELTF